MLELIGGVVIAVVFYAIGQWHYRYRMKHNPEAFEKFIQSVNDDPTLNKIEAALQRGVEEAKRKLRNMRS